MKRTFIIAGVCVLASAVLMIWGFAQQPEQAVQPAPVYVMLFTEDKGTDVLQLKQGAQAAVDELDASLQIYTTEQRLPEAEQLLGFLSDAAAQDRLAGLICPPVSEEVLQAAHALAEERGISLVVLAEESPWADACILTGERKKGAQFAAVLTKPPVVLLEGTDADIACLEGLTEAWGQEVAWHQGDANQLRAIFEALPQDAEVCVLSPTLVDALPGWDVGQRTVYGMAAGETRVALMEQRAVQGLLMEMPYAQGYLAVQAAARAPKQQNGQRIVYAPSRLVLREEMYDAENVKLVFPLLQ